MDPVKMVRKFVLDAEAAGRPLEKLATTKEFVEIIRKKLKIPDGQQTIVEGVPVFEYTTREHFTVLGQQYAGMRWDINMTEDDVTSLLKAVPDNELDKLTSIIIDQHMDYHGIADPVEKLDEASVRELRQELEELGFTDVSF